MVGHSQGEVSAAVVSGSLSLEDAARVVTLRSQAVRRRSGDGAMLLVERPLSEVEGLIAKYGPALSIAAVNTANSTVVSGEASAVDALIAELQAQALFCRKVNVDYASHSAQMDELLPELGAQLAALSPRAGELPLYSTVDGERLSGEQLDGAYWCRNLRQTVRLDKALAQLLEDGHGVFIEVSAHPVLTMTLSGACEEQGAVVVGSLQRERGGLHQLQRALLELHVQGYSLDWKQQLPAAARLLELPTYAFQRTRHWFEAGSHQQDAQALGLASAQHPLLGAQVALADNDGYVFSSRLSLSQTCVAEGSRSAGHGADAWDGHGGAGAARGARGGAGGGGRADVGAALGAAGAENVAVQLQLSVGGLDEAGQRSLSIYSRAEQGAWLRNASGVLSAAVTDAASAGAFDALRRWSLEGTERVELEGFYDRLREKGLEYGPAFQGLCELRRSGNTAYSRVALGENVRASAGNYGLHPALLDAALHGLLALDVGAGEGICLPFVWSKVQLHAAGASELRVRTELDVREPRWVYAAERFGVRGGRFRRAGRECRGAAGAPAATAAAAGTGAPSGALVPGGVPAGVVGCSGRADRAEIWW